MTTKYPLSVTHLVYYMSRIKSSISLWLALRARSPLRQDAGTAKAASRGRGPLMGREGGSIALYGLSASTGRQRADRMPAAASGGSGISSHGPSAATVPRKRKMAREPPPWAPQSKMKERVRREHPLFLYVNIQLSLGFLEFPKLARMELQQRMVHF